MKALICFCFLLGTSIAGNTPGAHSPAIKIITDGSGRGTAPANSFCVFPFMHKGTEFTECTKADYNAPWCYTTASFDIWGVCQAPVIYTDASKRGTAPAHSQCVFPFRYKNQMFTRCTKTDYTALWCSTTSNYDTDEKWGACLTPEAGLVTDDSGKGTAAAGLMCWFPFTYKGVPITTCTKTDYTVPWCSTTSNYDADGKWGVCRTKGT